MTFDHETNHLYISMSQD